MIISISKKKLIIISAAIVLVAVALAVGLYFGLRNTDDETPSAKRKIGVIATNGVECASIGGDIFKKNGNVADAAIAVIFCEGVAMPYSTGLGGGFIMTMYTKAKSKIETMIARERAPLAAHENMYANGESSSEGGLSVAVPGELKGLYSLYIKYGSLPWKDLVQPTIDLCKTGSTVTKAIASTLRGRQNKILSVPSLAEIFINPETGETWIEGDKIKRSQLVRTLEFIAVEKADALYNGSLTEDFLNDIKSFGGIITREDLLNYEVTWGAPVQTKLINDLTLYTVPLPGTGIILTYILNIINGFLPDLSVTSIHRLVEAYKYAYAKRGDLGDNGGLEMGELEQNLTSIEQAEYVRSLIDDTQTYQTYSHYGASFSQPDDFGTAHMSILAPNGDAISVTGTINDILGAKIRSQKTGIILNDEMDDFSVPGVDNIFGVPPSPANFVKPGNRPLSSMCPTIIIDKEGDVQMIIGAAGGTKITTAVAYVIYRHLWLKEPLQIAVDAKRLHHQLAPMRIQYEAGFDSEILEGLRQKQHVTDQNPMDSGFAALVAISKEGNTYSGAVDPRRGGSVVHVEI